MLFFVLVTGCVEYELNNPVDAVDDPDPIDTSVDTAGDTEDTGTADTEDTAPIDTGGAVATARVYANTSTELFEVDPESGATIKLGDFKDESGAVVEHFVDIAIDLDGHMFGGTYDSLYRIDPDTVIVKKVCDTDVDMMALAFTSDGSLFAGGESVIERIDVLNCSRTPLVSTSPYVTSGDLVGLPDGYLYWTIKGEGGDELVRVNATDGGAMWIGVIGVERLFGLGYDGGNLYGFSSTGQIVRIDPAGADSSIAATDNEKSWWGATTNPVVW